MRLHSAMVLLPGQHRPARRSRRLTLEAHSDAPSDAGSSGEMGGRGCDSDSTSGGFGVVALVREVPGVRTLILTPGLDWALKVGSIDESPVAA